MDFAFAYQLRAGLIGTADDKSLACLGTGRRIFLCHLF